MRRRAFVLWIATSVAGLAACRDEATPTPLAESSPVTTPPEPSPLPTPAVAPTATPGAAAATPAPTATPERAMLVSLYFLRDEKLAAVRRPIAPTPRVGTAALTELLAGPTDQEANWGFTTEIPGGTQLRDLAIADGVATVDLSSDFARGGGSFSMRARVAQVVFTLTQFSSVQAVRFLIDGRPVSAIGGEGVVVDPPPGRAAFEDLLPLIFVETPGPGETVTSPLRVTGTANTFEATFMVRLSTVDGAVLYERSAMATSGSGTRGAFDLMVPFEVSQPVDGTLRLWEYSARDGSEVNVVEIPVRLAP
ncbi:MAG: GerMN domain-containing protein [Thermomicrobium sp.]|nr:GerMN domain-containing protein [Thermomicrobium sp.]